MVWLNFIVFLLIIVIVCSPARHFVVERHRGAHDALLVITGSLHQPVVVTSILDRLAVISGEWELVTWDVTWTSGECFVSLLPLEYSLVQTSQEQTLERVPPPDGPQECSDKGKISTESDRCLPCYYQSPLKGHAKLTESL